MCMLDGCDEIVTTLNEGHYVTARKLHKCMECGREIPKGESYHTETFKHGGDVKTHKTCGHCMVVRGWLTKECGGWVYSMVEEDLGEHVSESGYYGMPLARLYVAMRNDWKRQDGMLRPVPPMPQTSYDKRKAAMDATQLASPDPQPKAPSGTGGGEQCQ